MALDVDGTLPGWTEVEEPAAEPSGSKIAKALRALLNAGPAVLCSGRSPLGMTRVCDELGLASADVLAIGNGRNAIERLRWAVRGVAVAQIPQDVRAAADAVTGATEDDGVALELERWFG
ncbi:HAD hydrolase family protein [Streptomyces sp. NBC_00365]|uniref:HAD family hydrolase n=1 Tax=Streptomyces sp. NBC_00365 TaxID=2975726 RepID=UPI0022545F83|nr:HAD hydrolase family protein [Streptomyces sp. NBC_00365]MCX5095301.1 HAD hydrolase family protein [Streptomyces sp. NBC_00365]